MTGFAATFVPNGRGHRWQKVAAAKAELAKRLGVDYTDVAKVGDRLPALDHRNTGQVH